MAETGGPTHLVCIGASAGGLEAITAFVSTLETNFPGSIVIAQHLSPTHRSLMAALVQRATAMPVLELQKKTKLEAGTIYIIPENKDAVITNGSVSLLGPSSKRGPRPSVNRLFESLARTWGTKSIAVLLSGTGSDGADGASAIDDAGGIVFAQDGDSAKYWSMPKSAIDRGIVRVIQPPEVIARSISDVVAGQELSTFEPEEIEPDAMEVIAKSAENKFDFGIMNYKSPTVLRRIIARMAATRTPTIEAYSSLIEQDRGEVRNLVDALLIPVTAFFRDTDAYDELREHLGTKLNECAKEGRPFRVWTPGCCTGEEAYSISMIVDEYLTENNLDVPVQIFATDLSETFIDVARRGVYGAERIVDIPAKYVEMYMREFSHGYRVIEKLRERMVFARHDILRSTPFLHLDLISCRNLLIYFKPEAQKQALTTLATSLDPGGLLFLGRSETVGDVQEAFNQVPGKHRIYARTSRTMTATTRGATAASIMRAQRRHIPGRKQVDTSLSDQERLDRYMVRQGPPTVLIDGNDLVMNLGGDTSKLFIIPQGPFPRDIFALVPEELTVDLRTTILGARRQQEPKQSRVVCCTKPGTDEETGHFWRIQATPTGNKENDGEVFITFESFGERPVSPTIEPMDEDAAIDLAGATVDLQQELMETRQHLNTVIEELEVSNEELQAANEELLSSNEEFQATNEELETTNEELQATNEELETVNDELSSKNREINELNLDLHNIQNSLENPLLVFDERLNVRALNPAAKTLLNAAGAGNLPNNMHDLGMILGDTQIYQAVLQYQKNQVIDETPAEIMGRSFKIGVSSYSDPPSDATSIVIILTDMTVLLKTQRDLSDQRRRQVELERLQRMILDGMSAQVALVDAEGAIVAVNRAWEEFAQSNGYAQPGFGLGDNYLRVCDEAFGDCAEEARTVADNLRRVLNTDLPEWTIDYPCHSPYQQRWFQCIIRAVESDGEHAAVVMHFDITDRVRAEHVLQESEERFRSAFENVAVGNIVIDDQGNIEVFNQAAEGIFGYKLEEVLGRNVKMLMPEPHRSHHDHYVRQYLQTGHGNVIGFGREVQGLRKDGEEFPMQIGIGVMRIGGKVAFVASVSDLSALKDLERQLQHARRMEAIGQLTGGIAHDFNNLMAVIMGNLEDALEQVGSDDEVTAKVEKALDAVNKGASLTQQLLSFARQQSLSPSSVDARDLIQDTIHLLERTLGEEIDIQTLFEDTPLPVRIDTGMFGNALLNLALNARDAMPGGGTLSIEVAQASAQEGRAKDTPDGPLLTSPHVRITVRDSGTGIDPKIVDRVMEPFFTTKDVGKGSGLGLSMVYGFIEQSNGQVHLKSDQDGTAISLYLPLANPAIGSIPSDQPVQSPPVRAKRRILIVEDDDAVRETLSSSLERTGHSTMEAPDAPSALAILEHNADSIDLVISDIVMPGEFNGLELARKIKASFPGTEILLTSGYPDRINEQDDMQEMGIEILPKPYTRDQLTEAIDRLPVSHLPPVDDSDAQSGTDTSLT